VIISLNLKKGILKAGANRRFAGEDIKAGQIVLDPGHRLRPQDIGSLVSMGIDRIEVRQRLKVALFSTGDEIVEPGTALPMGAVYDANRHMLAAILERLGHQVSDLGILPDRRDVVQDALARAALSHQAVITSGGASKGEEDHVVASLNDLGKVHFWQLAIKPGRPLAFGQVGDAAFIGLPGNPVAAALCLVRLVRPMLNVMAGGLWLQPVTYPVAANFAYRKKPGRREWLRVRLVTHPDGHQGLENFPRDGSGILTSLVLSDGFAELDEETTEITVGDPVNYLPFAGLGLDF
jgi:molybdopterin molybdotransferase